jgi:para-nitrobenzyl esterase
MVTDEFGGVDMPSGPIVATRTGRVQGRTRHGIAEHRGIPFASDPTGNLRFAAPAPHPGWTGVLDATRPGPACPQPPSRLHALMGEPVSTFDEAGCLTVNVWTPDVRASLPVLFWMHGGAWVSGSASWDWYSGARLAAKEGIVVVTANHRLGALGYLGIDGGNFGFLDQVAALEWTTENVAAFGGDPGLITVGGQSAGAESAAMLAAAPQTCGSVRRLLLQSGGVNGLAQPAAQAAAVAADFVDIIGGDPARLRTAPVDELLAAQVELIGRRGAGLVPPFGVIESDDVPSGGTVEFLRARDSIATSSLDVMVGWARDELFGFTGLDPRSASLTDEDVVGAVGAAVDADYRGLRPSATPAQRLAAINGNRFLMAPTLRLAEDRASRGEPTFVYRFDWSGSECGACHCIDLPFTFGNLDAWPGASMLGGATAESLVDLADRFGASIGEFVRTGRAPWPAYDTSTKTVARFDADRTDVVPGLAQDELAALGQ